MAPFASHHAYSFPGTLVPSRRRHARFRTIALKFSCRNGFFPGPRNLVHRAAECVRITTCSTPVQRQSLIQGNTCPVCKARDHYAACEVRGEQRRGEEKIVAQHLVPSKSLRRQRRRRRRRCTRFRSDRTMTSIFDTRDFFVRRVGVGADCEFTNIRVVASKKKGLRVNRERRSWR